MPGRDNLPKKTHKRKVLPSGLLSLYFPRVIAILVVMLMVASSISIVASSYQIGGSYNMHSSGSNIQVASSDLNSSYGASYMAVPHSMKSVSGANGTEYNGTVSALVTFSLNNQTALNSLLSNLQNMQSPSYHNYLKRNSVFVCLD